MSEQKAQPPLARPLGELTIEIADACNRQVLFGPLHEILRGRWENKHVSPMMISEKVADMPDAPGMHIHLDPRRKTARIYDPLTLPQNAGLLRQLQAYWRKQWMQTPEPLPEVVKDLTDNEVKSWLWEMVKLVNNDQARVVSGTCPKPDEVEALPGKIRVQWFNSSARAVKDRDELLAGKVEAAPLR